MSRILIFVTFILATIVTFLSFAPPYTGKWVYLWQLKVLEKKGSLSYLSGDEPNSEILIIMPTVAVPHNYSGIWKIWTNFKDDEIYIESNLKNGNLQGDIKAYDQKGLRSLARILMNRTGITIYNRDDGIDRRKEFKIPIE